MGPCWTRYRLLTSARRPLLLPRCAPLRPAASANKVAYVAAKHGIVGLTKAVALEPAEAGITCNAVCPGWGLTPLVQKQIDALAEREKLSPEEAKRKLLKEKQPSGEFVSSAQLGALAVFLCSDAASQIRGAAMPVDVAWTVQ